MNHPLIYCNGDSYSNHLYHPSLHNSTYANAVGRHFGGFVINSSISACCNRRIMRTSVHDLILQRQLNPNQRIIALIGLTYELRSELWEENLRPINEVESQFRTHRFTDKQNWRDRMLSGEDIFFDHKRADKEFFDKYTQGRAYYYSPYAERINLLCDCVMFQSLMHSLDIEFIVFQSRQAEKLENEYLLDFFKSQLNPDNFFDFESFGFLNWSLQQGFDPLDFLDRPEYGHPTAEAHSAFGEQILIPHLEKL